MSIKYLSFKTVWLSLCLVFAFSVTGFTQSQNQISFEEAGKFYHLGNYEKAIEIYTRLSDEGFQDANLYYNLGNSYFRDGSLSYALLNYKKALLLNPRHEDAAHNLKYAESLVEYRMEDKRSGYVKTVSYLLSHLTESEVYLIALMVLWGVLIFCMIRIRGRKELLDTRGKTAFIILSVVALFSFMKYYDARMMQDAIILGKEVELRYGPSTRDRVAIKVGEGVNVSVVDRREGWSRLKLINSETGWVKNSDIAEVKI